MKAFIIDRHKDGGRIAEMPEPEVKDNLDLWSGGHARIREVSIGGDLLPERTRATIHPNDTSTHIDNRTTTNSSELRKLI